jgi:diguanylate cyclase (GGDEF)-like protein
MRRSAAREAPPRLILRFAVCSGILLALAAAAILLVVRHFNTVQAERAATLQARFVAGSVLTGALESSDFEAPVTTERRAELDDFFASRVLDHGAVLVELMSAGGTVTYSNDHRLIATRVRERANVEEALKGTVRGDVTTVARGDGAETKVLRTYAPVAVPGGAGAVAIFQDYGPIAQAAESTFLPIAGIFEVALILLFVALVPILRRVTVRIRRQMDEIEHRAMHDELTGLPNRALFADRIEQAVAAAARERGGVAVLAFDLDRFKDVNNTLGHQTGDVLLRDLAERLRSCLRANETLARLGGDEFGILVPRGSVEDAFALATRVHETLEPPFVVDALPLEASASIGVAEYPAHGETVDALLRHADVAMHMAKEAHAPTAVYDEEQDTNDAARLALAGELRHAIESEQLVVFFQPKADLATGRIVGAEALVRWQHPERGFIPPNDFVPIAERTGLIKPLSRFVLAAAVRQCAAWNAQGHELHISVNLTIPDLLDLELPDRISALLESTGVDPSQLELEITETTILADPFRVRQVLERLDGMGLRMAIDDFGTGYSSLAYLRRLPVSTIKIDRSFVMGMDENASDATIVRSTIDLGRNLGLDIVAEGVETQAAWEALREHGCTLAQGYLISKPVPAGEFEALLEVPRSAKAATA